VVPTPELYAWKNGAPEDIAEIKKSETDETERDRLIRPKRRMF
jgi:hypothetical protein